MVFGSYNARNTSGPKSRRNFSTDRCFTVVANPCSTVITRRNLVPSSNLARFFCFIVSRFGADAKADTKTRHIPQRERDIKAQTPTAFRKVMSWPKR